MKYIWKAFLKTFSVLGEERDPSSNCGGIRKQLLPHLDVCLFVFLIRKQTTGLMAIYVFHMNPVTIN